MRKPELLSPAGTLKSMRYAFAYGADAVYAGQPRYSLRVRNNDFNKLENLAGGISEAHAQGKQFFVTVNISPHNAKLKTFLDDIKAVAELKPDAFIMADPGLIMLVREHWPEMPIHLSVQANTVNFATVKFWQTIGLTRIILSRELSLEEVADIRQACPDIELEVFVHGALCIAYSGRCLLSGYMSHRDPNQGTCTNTCRWKYQTREAQETETGDIQSLQAEPQLWTPSDASTSSAHGKLRTSPQPQLGDGKPVDGVYLLEEENRPGELMPAYEDEHGTYIFNSKDLRAVQHVHKLTEIGIDCLKIEGRTKSHFYVARTAQVYRKAIDDAVAGKPFDRHLMDELDSLANRGYTEGFYRRHVHDEYQNYERGISIAEQQQFVGEVLAYDAETELVQIDVKNHFECGERFELMLPQGNHNFTLDTLLDKDRRPIEIAKGSGHLVWIKIPVSGENIERGLLMRYLS